MKAQLKKGRLKVIYMSCDVYSKRFGDYSIKQGIEH